MRLSPTRLASVTFAAVAALAICLDTVPVRAEVPVQNMQDEDNVPAQSGDPGVARISDLSGRVDVHRSDASGSYAAVLNAPIGAGDYLTTRAGARAEIEFDYASLLRVAPSTQIRFARLDPRNHSLQLAEGTVELRVLRGLDAHPVVETPSATIVPSASGRYRVTVTHAGNTEITVRSGRAGITIGDGSSGRDLLPGSTLLVRGQGKNARATAIAVVADAAFDSWADGRDARFANVRDWAYSDNGMVGAADLDRYGQWTDSSYGQVWQPNDVPDGWSPYTDGRWFWQPYYGWTWIGYEPWGYAPYHYGRWFYAGRWCWYPGPYGPYSPYVYAPALVAFFGFGSGFAFGIAFGNIGWVALAPYETYYPWWGGSYGRRYYGYGYGHGYGHGYGYGRGWSRGAGPVYRNASAPGGAVAVSTRNFAAGSFDRISTVRGAELHGATPFTGVLPVAPTTRNLAFDGRNLAPVGRAPETARFASFGALTTRTPAFETERARVTGLAREQYGSHDAALQERTNEPNAIDRTGGLSARSGSEYDRASTVRPETLHSVTAESGASVWSRFGGESRTETEDTIAHASPVLVHDGARDDDVWSRFGESTGGDAYGRIPSYAERTVTTPDERSPMRTDPAYDAPARGYYAPARSYSPAVRTYASSAQRSYATPFRSYAAPVQRTYAAPLRTYYAPQRSYSVRSYSPSHVSSGSYSNGSFGRHR